MTTAQQGTAICAMGTGICHGHCQSGADKLPAENGEKRTRAATDGDCQQSDWRGLGYCSYKGAEVTEIAEVTEVTKVTVVITVTAPAKVTEANFAGKAAIAEK